MKQYDFEKKQVHSRDWKKRFIDAHHMLLSLFRLGIKTCAVMIPLLGVNWLFGLLLSLHKAFAYIFTIFNSTQVSFQ